MRVLGIPSGPILEPIWLASASHCLDLSVGILIVWIAVRLSIHLIIHRPETTMKARGSNEELTSFVIGMVDVESIYLSRILVTLKYFSPLIDWGGFFTLIHSVHKINV